MRLKPWLALTGTLLLFSTYEIVSKTIANTVPSLQINFWRFLVGGSVLLPIALIINAREGRHLTRRDLGKLIRLGIVNVGLSLPLLQQAIIYIPASVAAVLFCTNPLFAHIFTALAAHEPMSKRTWAGLLLSLGGMALIIGAEITRLSFSWQSLLGLVLTIVAAVLFGLYIVMAKGIAEEVGSITANAIPFIAGALFTLPLLLWRGTPLFIFDPVAWPQMLYLTLGITCGAFLLLLYALRFLPAATGSLIFFIKPVLATVFAAWWLKETVPPAFLLGTLIVVSGLFCTHKKNQPAMMGADQK